jgi:hypothetical protein
VLSENKKFLLESVTGVLIVAVAGNTLTWVAWALLQRVLPSSVTAGSIAAALQARIPLAYVLVSLIISLALVGLLLDRKYLAGDLRPDLARPR